MKANLPHYEPITVHNKDTYISERSSMRTALGDRRRVEVCERLRSRILKKRSVCVSRLAEEEKERRCFSRFLNSTKLNNEEVIDYICTTSMLGPITNGDEWFYPEEHVLIIVNFKLAYSKTQM